MEQLLSFVLFSHFLSLKKVSPIKSNMQFLKRGNIIRCVNMKYIEKRMIVFENGPLSKTFSKLGTLSLRWARPQWLVELAQTVAWTKLA